MPTPAQVQAQSPRGRCTDVLARFSATELDVATAGDSCALHLHTLRGTVVTVLPLEVFAEKCRGLRDCNGRPLPALRVSRETRLEPATAPVPPSPRPAAAFVRKPEVHARAARAWALLDADLGLAAADAAASVGLTSIQLSNWICAFHPGELQQRRRDAGLPILVRSRRPANLATAAARGEPLLKPGGGL